MLIILKTIEWHSYLVGTKKDQLRGVSYVFAVGPRNRMLTIAELVVLKNLCWLELIQFHDMAHKFKVAFFWWLVGFQVGFTLR